MVWKWVIRYRPMQRMVEPGEEQQPGRLDGAGGDDHVAGGQEALGTVGTDDIDPGGPAALDADPGHEGLGQQLGPTGGHGPLQHGDGIALGVDGAAEVGAEAAVVAGRPAVVGDAVGRGGGRIGVVAEPLGGGRRTGWRRTWGARRHGEGTRPGGGEGVGPLGAGHPDGPLHLGVVGLELVVVEGPVGHLGVGLGTEQRQDPEVVGPEPGHLAVGVGATAAHRGRDRVDLAHVDVVPVGLARSGRCGARPGGRDRGSTGCGT